MSVRPKLKQERETPAELECDGSKLPDGWAMPLLGEIATIKQGNSKLTKKTYKTDGKYVAFSGSGPDGLVDEFEFEGNAIILSAVGARCGKCFRASGKWTAIANTAVIRTWIESPTLLEYLFLLVNNEDFWPKGGTAQPFVQTGQAQRETRIPLPPLAEQLRIVAKLEILLGKVSSSQQRLSQVPGLLNRFRQSVLAAACSGKLTADWREENEDVEPAAELLERLHTERRKTWLLSHPNRKYQEPDQLEDDDLEAIPESWLWTNFDHCASEITVGHVGPMKDRYVDSGIAFLRSQNVRPLRFDPMGLVRIPKDFQAELAKSKLIGGEILVVRSGANTGDCCVFPRDMPEANCADLVITRPLSGLCAEYGAMYVASPIGQAAIGLRQTGIAQPHFNIGAMRVKPFPLPPLAEQQEIVRRAEKLFSFADQIESRLAEAQTHVDRLTQSLLAKAFRGELVPTEHALAERESREYETAEQLLARLQKQRSVSEPSRNDSPSAKAGRRRRAAR